MHVSLPAVVKLVILWGSGHENDTHELHRQSAEAAEMKTTDEEGEVGYVHLAAISPSMSVVHASIDSYSVRVNTDVSFFEVQGARKTTAHAYTCVHVFFTC